MQNRKVECPKKRTVNDHCLIHFYKRTDDDKSFHQNIFFNELEEITFLVEVPLQLFKR